MNQDVINCFQNQAKRQEANHVKSILQSGGYEVKEL